MQDTSTSISDIRSQFLLEMYNLSNASTSSPISYTQVAELVGIDDAQDTFSVCKYLEGEGLLKFISTPDLIAITHHGILAVEETGVLDTSEKMNLRYQFLQLLFDLTGGDVFHSTSLTAFSKGLGVSKEKACDIWQYLSEEGLVTSDSSSLIKITHEGLKLIEDIQSTEENDLNNQGEVVQQRYTYFFTFAPDTTESPTYPFVVRTVCSEDDEDLIIFTFNLGIFNTDRLPTSSKYISIKNIRKLIEKHNVSWLDIRNNDTWYVDLSRFRSTFFFDDYPISWLNGTVQVEPLIEMESTNPLNRNGSFGPNFFHAFLKFAISQEIIMSSSIAIHEIPVEITQSLELFRKDYPDPAKVAFIMMQFGSTKWGSPQTLDRKSAKLRLINKCQVESKTHFVFDSHFSKT